MAEDEIKEGEAVPEETQEAPPAAEEPAAPVGAEFVPAGSRKPKSDVYTLFLIFTFVVFLAGCIIAGREAWECYDVQFWAFTKEPVKNQAQGEEAVPAETTPPAAEGAGGAPATPPVVPGTPLGPTAPVTPPPAPQ